MSDMPSGRGRFNSNTAAPDLGGWECFDPEVLKGIFANKDMNKEPRQLPPDKLQHVLDFAEFIRTTEIETVMGSNAHGESAAAFAKSFMCFGDNNIMVIPALFEGNALGTDSVERAKDVHAVTTRILSLVTEAYAYLFSSEAWTADKCGGCGKPYGKEGMQCECGASMMPSQNPYRKEVLMVNCAIAGGDNYIWMHHIVRDDEGTVIEINLDEEKSGNMGKGMEGRLGSPWVLYPWMAPHIIVNTPVFADRLGFPLKDGMREMAEMVERICPPDYEIMRIQPGTLDDFEKREWQKGWEWN